MRSKDDVRRTQREGLLRNDQTHPSSCVWVLETEEKSQKFDVCCRNKDIKGAMWIYKIGSRLHHYDESYEHNDYDGTDMYRNAKKTTSENAYKNSINSRSTIIKNAKKPGNTA